MGVWGRGGEVGERWGDNGVLRRLPQPEELRCRRLPRRSGMPVGVIGGPGRVNWE